jgi:hypothetical protein
MIRPHPEGVKHVLDRRVGRALLCDHGSDRPVPRGLAMTHIRRLVIAGVVLLSSALGAAPSVASDGQMTWALHISLACASRGPTS